MRNRMPLLLVALAAVLAACGDGGDSQNAEGGDTEGSQITVTGDVFQVGDESTCANPSLGSAAGSQVTVRDGEGSVIGTTNADSSGEVNPIGGIGGCYIDYPFSVSLPETEFYEFSVEGSSATAAPLSYEQLEAEDFSIRLEYS